MQRVRTLFPAQYATGTPQYTCTSNGREDTVYSRQVHRKVNYLLNSVDVDEFAHKTVAECFESAPFCAIVNATEMVWKADEPLRLWYMYI